jgi:hypothetical protein
MRFHDSRDWSSFGVHGNRVLRISAISAGNLSVKLQ